MCTGKTSAILMAALLLLGPFLCVPCAVNSTAVDVTAVPPVNPTQGNPAQPTVVFYEGMGQPWSITDTGFWGYSQMANDLEEMGFRVSASSQPLMALTGRLSRGDILVVGISLWTSYNQNDVTALVEHVTSGGNLILIGEHENEADINKFPNAVAGHFGMTFSPEIIIDTVDHADFTFDEMHRAWILGRALPPLKAMDNIMLPAACPVLLPETGLVLLRAGEHSSHPNAAVAGAVIHDSGGKIVCIGDSEFPINGDSGIFWNYGDNSMFTLDLFDWISDRTVEKASAKPEYTLITGGSVEMSIAVTGDYQPYFLENNCSVSASPPDVDGTVHITVDIHSDGFFDVVHGNVSERVLVLVLKGRLGRVLIEESWNSRKADTTPWGILDLARGLRDAGLEVFAGEKEGRWEGFDSVAIVGPRSAIPENVTGDSRVFVADCYHSSFDYAESIWKEMRDGGFPGPKPPSEGLLSREGFGWSHALLYDPGSARTNDPFPARVEHRFGFHFRSERATTLRAFPPDSNLIASGDFDSWGEMYDPFQNHFMNSYLFFEESMDLQAVDVGAATYLTFAFGASWSLTNENGGDPNFNLLVLTIADWLLLDVRADRGMLSREVVVSVRGPERLTSMSAGMDANNMRPGTPADDIWRSSFDSAWASRAHVTVRLSYGDRVMGAYSFSVDIDDSSLPMRLGIPALLICISVGALVIALRKVRKLRKKPGNGKEQRFQG